MTTIKKYSPCYYCGDKELGEVIRKDGKDGVCRIKQDFIPLRLITKDGYEVREVCNECYAKIPKKDFEPNVMFTIGIRKLNIALGKIYSTKN